MKSILFVLPFVALTFCCWGVYGPVLHHGQEQMGDYETTKQLSTLRPLICVGIAYFAIAVVYPVVMLRTQGEKGAWTTGGFIWSIAAGAAGAIGALGITLAFKFRGSPVFVMPLVFGCAPVVNTFVTMFMSKSFRQASMIFFFGVGVVAVGAAGVLTFKPTNKSSDLKEVAAKYPEVTVEETDQDRLRIVGIDKEDNRREWLLGSKDDLKEEDNLLAYQLYQLDQQRARQPNLGQWLMIIFSISLTACCWGSYGPVLHKGQMKMKGSRLRPFMCVGLAYFAIAVVVPFMLMPAFPAEPGGWSLGGMAWSLAAGVAGAFGALGIVYAFNFGGKPIFVMPLVFGCAPVVNTFMTMIESWWSSGGIGPISFPFVLSLFLVICGAVTVLVFAPKPGPPAKPATPEATPQTKREADASPEAETSKEQTAGTADE